MGSRRKDNTKVKYIFCDRFKAVPLPKIQDAIAKAIGNTIGVKVTVDLGNLQFKTSSDSFLHGSPLTGSVSGLIKIEPE